MAKHTFINSIKIFSLFLVFFPFLGSTTSPYKYNKQMSGQIKLNYYHSPNDMAKNSVSVAKNLLNDKIPNYNSIAMNWASTTQVNMPNGVRVIRFSNHLNGVRIIDDWAMVIFDKSDHIIRIEYSYSHITNLTDKSANHWKISANGITNSLIQNKTLITSQNPRRIWLKQNNILLPSYQVNTIEPENNHPIIYTNTYSGIDGHFISKHSITDSIAYSYRVYTDLNGSINDDVHGFWQPHPTGIADGFFPPNFANQNLITVEEVSNNVDDPWLVPDATETVGNNVDVFFNSLLLPNGTYDFGFDGGAYGPQYQPVDGDFRAQKGIDNAFDYVYNNAISADDFFQLPSDPMPSNPSPDDPQINAKLVHAFYMANYMHDIFYDAGFTELAGNAQNDNYGRGGIENDRMIIHGNCRSAFISTPIDGEQPVMCLGRNGSSSSNKGASFDYTVFAHEWAHYMYRRLVNQDNLGLGNQARSLNEGWADFIGMFMALKESHFTSPSSPGFTSTYTVGAYFNIDYSYWVFLDPDGTNPDPYFYGTRRWPYGASNPFTFKHIEHKQELPLNYDYFDWKWRSKFNSEVHTSGEVWAATVWDCFRDIILDRTDKSFTQNYTSLTQYIVAGMVSTPPNPTFIEARNGLLIGMQITDERDWHTCRQAFTNRGMGAGSLAPARESVIHVDVQESFIDTDLSLRIIARELNDSIGSLDNDGILDSAESGELVIKFKNTGFMDITSAAINLDGSPDFDLLFSNPIVLTNLAINEEVEVSFPIKLRHQRHYDSTAFNFNIELNGTDPNSYQNYDEVFELKTHYDTGIASEQTQDLIFPESLSLWTQDKISRYPIIDPSFTRFDNGNFNTSLKIDEEYGGFEVALVSPWLQKSVDGIFISFDHAYDFTDNNNQFAILEYSLDDENWLTVPDEFNIIVNFRNISANYPAFTNQQMAIFGLAVGTQFKLRFRIFANSDTPGVPASWILDNIFISGITEQPFIEAIEQQIGDIIFIDGFEN